MLRKHIFVIASFLSSASLAQTPVPSTQESEIAKRVESLLGRTDAKWTPAMIRPMSANTTKDCRFSQERPVCLVAIDITVADRKCSGNVTIGTIKIPKGSPPVAIAWYLTGALPAGASYKFLEDYEVEPVDNVKGQLTDGSRESDTVFVWKHINSEAVTIQYLPHVVYQAAPSERFARCPVADPKIISDGP